MAQSTASGHQRADLVSSPPASNDATAVEPDIHLAQLAVRMHCPMSWPEGMQCNNCQAPFPCPTNRWAYGILQRTGWSEEQILALDTRVGPWF